MTPGFLLTRQWADDRDGLRLDFWLSTPHGPMAVSIHGQQALFFIHQRDAAAAAELLGTSRVTLWKKIGKYAIEIPG